MKTRQPQATAAQTYAARRNDIARLLDVLRMELDRHDVNQKSDPTNWGHAGDLSKVRSDLIDLVGCMSGMDAEQIAEFLDDAD